MEGDQPGIGVITGTTITSGSSGRIAVSCGEIVVALRVLLLRDHAPTRQRTASAQTVELFRGEE
jgi:hypothetical protein